MKINLLKYLCCPVCEENLTSSHYLQIGKEIVDGFLRCSKCKEMWLIIDGIPRFIGHHFLNSLASYNSFLRKYKTNLSSNGYKIKGGDGPENSKLEDLKEKTSSYFGYEWNYFKDWGWIDDKDVTEEERKYDYRGGLISNTEAAFKGKCMLDHIDLVEGKVVLDAGCGNGRYTNQAAKYGAVVIGVDLGYGVESAYEHLKTSENVHIIQGDLFALPFKRNIFDSAFSNGVLMHTGNAKKAFCSITKHIKQEGFFVAHLYHKRNWIFEIVDGTIRFITTELSIENNLKFARFMANWGKHLMKKGKWQRYFKYIEVLPTLHHMYDWYSAPIATHHTYTEVKNWFNEMGFDIIRSNEPYKITLMNKPESLTLKGQKK